MCVTGLVSVDAERRFGNRHHELRFTRSSVLWKVTALDDHRLHSLLQQIQAPERKCRIQTRRLREAQY